MELEKINSSNERQIRDYVSELRSKYISKYVERNEKGFETYLKKIKKENKEFALLERIAKQKNELSGRIKDMEKAIEEGYSISVSVDTYGCSDGEVKFKRASDTDYSDGVIKTSKERTCSYEKSNEITKALLEKDVGKVNKLVTELEDMVGD